MGEERATTGRPYNDKSPKIAFRLRENAKFDCIASASAPRCLTFFCRGDQWSPAEKRSPPYRIDRFTQHTQKEVRNAETRRRPQGNMQTKILSAAETAEAGEILRRGGLVAFPTETVYGLGGNALDADAARKIYEAKGRPSDNPLIVHLADAGQAEQYAVTDDAFYRLAALFMPGPITVILPKKDCIPGAVTGGLDSVALRVPSHEVAHRMLRDAGVPVAAPSANLSGSPSPTVFAHVRADLWGRVDALLDGGDCRFGVESTIVKMQDGVLRLLRPGAVTPEDLKKAGFCVEIDPAVTQKFEGRPECPGMKYRHYAPKSPVVILDGGDRAVYDFLRDKTHCGILCYAEDTELLTRENSMSMGSRNDLETQAHRLFACLRAMPELDVIYARMPSKEGIGLAVFNRLIKAAGYQVIHLEN